MLERIENKSSTLFPLDEPLCLAHIISMIPSMALGAEASSATPFDAVSWVSASAHLPIPNCFTHDFSEPPLRGIPGVRQGAFGTQVLIPELALVEVNAVLAPLEFVGTGSELGRGYAGGELPPNVQNEFSRAGGFFERLVRAENREAEEIASRQLAPPIDIRTRLMPTDIFHEHVAATGDQ